MYQCFALAFSYICLSDWISIVNGLFTVVYCVYIVLLDFLKFLLKSAEPTHPHSGTKTQFFVVNRFNKSRNQPIPTRGRKPFFSQFPFGHEMNQPIPTRGRKLNTYFSFDKIAENQPIPTRGRKHSRLVFHIVVNRNQPNPKRGRKFYKGS